MDWTNFFKLNVMKKDATGLHPYFTSNLCVPDKFLIEDLLITNFEHWELTELEKKRLTLSLRKIIHCHQYFNSLEFNRISTIFLDRLAREKDHELHFCTQAGGIYLFLAAIKNHHGDLSGKKIICETSEMPLPVMQLPQSHKLHIQFIFRARPVSFLTGLPSLWARPEILKLFDPKAMKSEVA